MLEMMIYTMFAIVSMVRITGVEISNKPKCTKQKVISKSLKTLKIPLKTVCAILEMMIYTMFAIVTMVRIARVEISNKPKCTKQTAISKSWKTL